MLYHEPSDQPYNNVIWYKDLIEKIDKTESEGFEDSNFDQIKPEVEVLGLIDEIIKEIHNYKIDTEKKDVVIGKLSRIKEKLKI